MNSIYRSCLKVALLCALGMAGACDAQAQAPQTSSQATGFYEDALTRFEQKDFAGAVIQLKNALRSNNAQLPVHVLLGKALLENGDPIGAEVALVEALRLGVNRAEVAIPLARVLLKLGRPQLVIDDPRLEASGLPRSTQAELLILKAEAQADVGDSRQALRLLDESRAIEPASLKALLAEVPIRIRAREFVEARAAAERALAGSPKSADGNYLLGSVHHAQGNVSGAIESYGRALDAEPKHAEALLARAGLLIDSNRAVEAKRDVDAARVVANKDPRAAYLAALLAERSGNSTAAKAALAEVTALLDPVPIEAFRYRPQLLILGGLSHYGLGNNEKALPYLEAAQRAQPGSPTAKLFAQLLIRGGNVDSAVLTLEGYLRTHPRDWQAQILLADAHQSRGRHARAVQVLQEALKQGNSPTVQAALGQALLRSGQPNEALQQLEAAFRRDPTLNDAGATLVSLYLRSRQPKKAVAVAQSLVKQQPKNPLSHNLLGGAQAQSGNAKAARVAFEAALSLDPANSQAELNLHRLDVAQGDVSTAGIRLRRVLEREPSNVEALIAAAMLTDRVGNAAETLKYLEQASAHSPPTDSRAALLLLTKHLQSGRLVEAEGVVKQLNLNAPDQVAVLVANAKVLLAQRKTDEARTYLTRASRAAEFDSGAQVQVARMQLQAMDAKGANYSLSKALQAKPDHLPAQALMVEVELYLGESAKAEQRAKSIAQRFPKLSIGHALVGQVAMVGDQVPAGIAAYKRAHDLQPSTESVIRLHRALGQKDPSASNQLLLTWLKAHPNDALVQQALGESFARAGNMNEAKRYFEAVLKQRPDSVAVLNNMAHVLIALKDSAATAAANRALALQPQSSQVIATAGWAAFHAGQAGRALELLRDARLRDPTIGEVRYFLAEVLVTMGRKEEAKQELQVALAAGESLLSKSQATKLLGSLK